MSRWRALFAGLREPRVKAALKALLAAFILLSVWRVLSGYRAALAGRLEQLDWSWLLLGLVLATVYRVINAYGWVWVLRSLGQRIPGRTGVRLWLVSETMRWLPGSVWSFFSRVAQARNLGVPALTASLSLPLELLLTIAAWALTAGVGLGISGTASAWLAHIPALGLLLAALGGLALLAAPFVLARVRPASRFAQKLQGLERSLRQLKAARPRLGWLAATLALFMVLCVLNGLAFAVILRATSAATPSLLATIGVNAAGWLVGFFAFFAPAGLGVREGGMAAMLAPVMPVDAAIVGVLLWRSIQIIVELLCLAGCFTPVAISTMRRIGARRSAEVG